VSIIGTVVKHEQAVYRCVLEHADDSRSLEVPQWMFDVVACCRIALSLTPAVTCEALSELRRLIESACRPDAHAVLQAEHLSTLDPGGACAIQESSALGRSVGAVSPARNDPAMDELAVRSAPPGAVRWHGFCDYIAEVVSSNDWVGRRAMSEKIHPQHLARKARLRELRY
jgi:hypothetical protein